MVVDAAPTAAGNWTTAGARGYPGWTRRSCALLMAQPRVVGDVRLARAAERALDKLMAALPASLREQAAALERVRGQVPREGPPRAGAVLR